MVLIGKCNSNGVLLINCDKSETKSDASMSVLTLINKTAVRQKREQREEPQ